MNVVINVKPDNGDGFPLCIGSRDILRWERMCGGNLNRLTAGKISDVYSLAWSACVAKGLFVGDLQAFEAACEVDAPNAVHDEEDPTKPEVSAAR